jgi:hypothetical protein
MNVARYLPILNTLNGAADSKNESLEESLMRREWEILFGSLSDPWYIVARHSIL